MTRPGASRTWTAVLRGAPGPVAWAARWTLMLLISVCAANAEPVFVTSEPFGAAIVIDGLARPERTPALLDLAPGTYSVELVRDGHAPGSGPVEVLADQPAVFERELLARYVLLDAPEEEDRASLALPVGEYEVGRDLGVLLVRPVYPRERRLGVMRVLTPASVVAALAVSGWSALAPPDDARYGLIPAVAAQLVAAGSAVYSGMLAADRDRFFAEWAPPERPYFRVSATSTLQEALELLERGDLAGAEERFRELVSRHPDAPGVPEALYTLGRLAAIDGRIDEARSQLRRLVLEYPVPSYHDRALLQLARIAAELDRTVEAEGYLDSITWSDPSVTPDAVRIIRDLIAR